MNICMHFHVTCLLMKILLRDERIHAHPSGKLRKLFFCLLSIQGQQFHTPICPVRWIKLQVRLRKASSFVSRNTDLLLSPRFQELGFSTLPFSGDTHISRRAQCMWKDISLLKTFFTSVQAVQFRIKRSRNVSTVCSTKHATLTLLRELLLVLFFAILGSYIKMHGVTQLLVWGFGKCRFIALVLYRSSHA